ncbi:protein MAIN-LIKE 1-like [Camellia sinensis]|uniref:protein MAIN-LIKE 1-like n=1 Tax=Camellia sinensis TaxID=4442 RepID=UPI001035D51E|nr:protein MAIN-LIKE 1-like [Camellia sinensis]
MRFWLYNIVYVEAHKLLQPGDKILKTLAVELAEYQVCVDVFITAQSYVDIASISVIPRTTTGQFAKLSMYANIWHLEMDDPSRIPPTTSERRCRALTNPARARGRGRGRGRGRDRGRGDDIVLEEAPQILEEDVIDNGSGDDDDATDVNQVDEERNPLRCYNHASKILEWRWWSRTDNRRFRDIVQQSGLSSLVHCTYRFVNRIVISAFVERWQPETNTFHLTVGEMTMTLDDVGTILGIPITGRSVSAATLTDQQAHAFVVDALGVDDAEATEELSSARGQSVKLEWLQTKFNGCKDSDTEESIACAARAYLLFLLGCTLFSDKSGTRVPVVYLKLLMDLSDIHTYAWGAAALAYLYRQLGFATRSAVRQMAGYMTLLEAWIYEHFRPFRPRQNMQYTVQLPHVHRWTPRREAGSTISHLQALREELDRLAFDEVTWDPYRHCRQHHPCHEITFYTGCLKCLDVVEPYHPERVLRQFGRIQTIPPAPLDPVRAVRGVTAGRYKVMYQYLDQIWESWDNHVLSARRRSTPDAERIDHALRIAHPIIEAGHDASVREPDRLYAP